MTDDTNGAAVSLTDRIIHWLMPDLTAALNKQGWVHTGDAARILRDEGHPDAANIVERMHVVELAEPRGLTFTELEADRNAALGRAPLHAEPIPCYEDDVSRCGCSTCISQPKIPGKRPDSKPPSQEPVRAPRPCCHTTGPNHHPACQESK